MSPRPSSFPALLAALLAVPSVVLVVLAGGAGATVERPVVTVRSFEYAPDPVEVASGGVVRWTWRGDERHSVTADDARFDSDPECQDNLLLRDECRTAGDPDFEWVAPEVAQRTVVTYRCKLHGESEGMAGRVVVVPAPSPSPSPSPSSAPDGGSGGSPAGTTAPSPTADEEAAGGSGSGGDGAGPSPGGARGFVRPPAFGSQPPPAAAGTEPGVAAPEVAGPDEPLEEFPEPAPIPSPSASADLGEVAVDLPGSGDGPDRTVLLAIATVAVTGTAVAFGWIVLFGQPWA